VRAALASRARRRTGRGVGVEGGAAFESEVPLVFSEYLSRVKASVPAPIKLSRATERAKARAEEGRQLFPSPHPLRSYLLHCDGSHSTSAPLSAPHQSSGRTSCTPPRRNKPHLLLPPPHSASPPYRRPAPLLGHQAAQTMHTTSTRRVRESQGERWGAGGAASSTMAAHQRRERVRRQQRGCGGSRGQADLLVLLLSPCKDRACDGGRACDLLTTAERPSRPASGKAAHAAMLTAIGAQFTHALVCATCSAARRSCAELHPLLLAPPLRVALSKLALEAVCGARLEPRGPSATSLGATRSPARDGRLHLGAELPLFAEQSCRSSPSSCARGARTSLALYMLQLCLCSRCFVT